MLTFLESWGLKPLTDSLILFGGGASRSAEEAMLPLPDEKRAVVCQHAEESTAAAGKKRQTEAPLQREVL